MKILHVVQQYWPFRCGSSRYFQIPSEYFAAKGHEVTVFTTDALENGYFEDASRRRIDRPVEVHNGVSIRRFRARHLSKMTRNRLHDAIPFRWAKHLFYLPVVPGLLFTSLRRHDFDIVHGGILPYGILLYAAREIARRCGAPLVMSPHLHVGEPTGGIVLATHTDPYQIELLKGADLLYAQSEIEKRKLVELGIPESSVEVLGNGVSLEELAGGTAARFRERHRVGGPVVLFLGTRSYDKGTVHVVNACLKLFREGKRFTLVLAGSSSNRDFVEFHASLRPGDKKDILILDNIPEEDKKDLLDAASLLALPSRNEAFGVVFLEAWAYGKPVIGAIAGGIPDVISEGGDGFLVPFGDTDALASRIARLLDDPALAARMGEAGRRKLLAQFAIGRKLSILECAYERLVAARRIGSGTI